MGTPLGTKKRHTIIAGPPPVVIIANTAFLSPYITSLVADTAAADPTIEDVNVAGHGYRKYPGGPLLQREPSIRSYDGAKPISRGITLPGKNAYIEVHTSVSNPKIIDVVTFTFTGSFYLLRGWIKAHTAAGKKFNLRSPGGKPFLMVGA